VVADKFEENFPWKRKSEHVKEKKMVKKEKKVKKEQHGELAEKR
jgi:hypothetical protein